MARPISFAALEDKNYEPVTDPRQIAASRCLSLLVACSQTSTILVENAINRNPERVMDSMSQLVMSLLESYESGLDADIQTLAKMLGCQLVMVPQGGKADA